MSYFVGLNYTLANEDARIEHGLLADGVPGVLAVAGSGARVLPLLARSPKQLTVIDVSREQLLLAELRVQAARTLDRDDFLALMGYTPLEASRRVQLLSKLKLSEDGTRFWAETRDQWAARGWIWLGRWENHFLKINRILRLLLGKRIDLIFEAKTLAEQQALYKKHWRPVLFRSFLRLVASEWVFDRFLYRGHFSGKESHRTEQRAPWQFFEEEFARIFRTSLVRENYFFQMLFLGELRFAEGFPFEAKPEVLAAIRKGAAETHVEYVRDDLLSHTLGRPYSFYSLSDTFSYFPEDQARGFLDRFHRETPAGAVAVFRSFLRSPGGLEFKTWREQTEKQNRAAELDLTGVYRFHIFQKHPQEIE